MAISATTVWEVRTTGNDNNGGGFDSSFGGTDYSQQDTAVLTPGNLDTPGAASTQLNFPSGGLTGVMIGNVIQITAGTNFTTGFYTIVALLSGTAVTLDRTPTPSLAGSSGVGNVGGALVSPGKAASGMASGNDCYVKSGTYTVTSASTNVSAGCVSLPSGGSGDPTRIVGYETTRTDGCPTNNRPIIISDSVITTFTLVAGAGANASVENIAADGNSRTSSRGIAHLTSAGRIHNCLTSNCTNNGINAASNVYVTGCRATGCSTAAAILAGGLSVGCVAHGNTNIGFQGPSTAVFQDCIAYSNTGAASDGFQISTSASASCLNCTAYANGRDGFRSQNTSTAPVTFLNCLAVSNSAYGFRAGAGTTYNGLWLINCAAYNNTTANYDTFIPAVGRINCLTLTADPFVSATTDFALNYTGGGGAAVMSAGYPSTFPTGSTRSYLDIGAAQRPVPTFTVVGGSGPTTNPQTSEITITKKDAYTLSPLRPLIFAKQSTSTWPTSLSTYTITLYMTQSVNVEVSGAAAFNAVGSAVSDSTVYVFMASTQTDTFGIGDGAYDYQLLATKGSEAWTLETGVATVVPELVP